MSMLACLGPSAEAVREMYLSRLQANTEVGWHRYILVFKICLSNDQMFFLSAFDIMEIIYILGPAAQGCDSRVDVCLRRQSARINRDVS